MIRSAAMLRPSGRDLKMSIKTCALGGLLLSVLSVRALSADQTVVESEAQIHQRATERLALPAPETVIEQPVFPTRNFGPAVIEKPQVTLSVTADPLLTAVGYGPYGVAGVYGGYYRRYYVPPVYRYGYYYHRPWYYGYYARYPYYLRPYYGYPIGPPGPFLYGPPAVYAYPPGAYAW
jgi:hypothetical protein